MIDRYRTLTLVCALLAVLAPTHLEGQFRRGRAVQGNIDSWAPIAVGIHGGYDDASRAELIGVHASIPIIRDGRVEVLPSYDLTFLTGAKDHQYGVEAVFVTGGKSGGLYLGGGVGYRNTVIDGTTASPRNTFFGYSIVAGFKSGSGGRFVTRLQLRWIFLQDIAADFRPVPFTLGVGFPLWGRTPSGS